MQEFHKKNRPAKHPLDIWKGEDVTSLLVDFYKANFTRAGLTEELAKKFVLKAWENRSSQDGESLRKVCDKILLQAKKETKKPSDERDPLDLIDLSNVGTFLDIGANKLSTINYYSEKFKNIKKFIGVDIIPQRSLFSDSHRSIYYHVDAKAKSFPVDNKSIDFINIQFVLHHFSDLASIRRILKICQDIIKSGGTLLLWEETFTKSYGLTEAENNKKLGIKTNDLLTERFYNFAEDKRWEFIIANDWLINVNNPHMPWTGQYYVWEEWISLLDEYEFSLKQQFNFGLRINGRLKQGVHMLGLFKKRIN